MKNVTAIGLLKHADLDNKMKKLSVNGQIKDCRSLAVCSERCVIDRFINYLLPLGISIRFNSTSLSNE